LSFSKLYKSLFNNYTYLHNIDRVQLIRDQIIKNTDFALYDNNIILLDDDDFSFVMVNKNNMLIDVNADYLEV
jgi:hypothetical protein